MSNENKAVDVLIAMAEAEKLFEQGNPARAVKKFEEALSLAYCLPENSSLDPCFIARCNAGLSVVLGQTDRDVINDNYFFPVTTIKIPVFVFL